MVSIKFPSEWEFDRRALEISDQDIIEGLSRKSRSHDLPSWWPKLPADFEAEREHREHRELAREILTREIAGMILEMIEKRDPVRGEIPERNHGG